MCLYLFLIQRLKWKDKQTYSIVVSIPITLSSPGDEEFAVLEEKGVKGRYASIERILELPGDKVEWRMATSSSAGGRIPQFITDAVLPEAIAKVYFTLLIRQPTTEK